MRFFRLSCHMQCLGVALLLSASVAQAVNITWTNAAGGDFQTPGNWDSNMVPGSADVAIFKLTTQPYTVIWTGSITNDAVRVIAGTVTWDLQGKTYFLANSVSNSIVGTASTAPLFTLTNGTVQTMSANYARQFMLLGSGTTIRILAGAYLKNASYLNLGSGTKLIVDGTNAKADPGISYMGGWLGAVVVTNGGYFEASQGSNIGAGGSLRVSGAGLRAFISVAALNATGFMLFNSGASVRNFSTTLTWSGSLTLDNARHYYSVTNTTAGLVTLSGTNAILQGSGSLEFNRFVNSGGNIRPGGANKAGTLSVTGGLSNAVPGSGTIDIELGGGDTNQYDRLQLTARGSLPRTLWAGGALNVKLIDGFQPHRNDVFDILDFSSSVGSFDSVNLPGDDPETRWDTSNLYTTGELRFVGALSGTLMIVR